MFFFLSPRFQQLNTAQKLSIFKFLFLFYLVDTFYSLSLPFPAWPLFLIVLYNGVKKIQVIKAWLATRIRTENCLCWFQNYQKGILHETSNRMFSQRFECQFQLGRFYALWLMFFQRRWTPISEMNKEQFLHYFF